MNQTKKTSCILLFTYNKTSQTEGTLRSVPVLFKDEILSLARRILPISLGKAVDVSSGSLHDRGPWVRLVPNGTVHIEDVKDEDPLPSWVGETA